MPFELLRWVPQHILPFFKLSMDPSHGVDSPSWFAFPIQAGSAISTSSRLLSSYLHHIKYLSTYGIDSPGLPTARNFLVWRSPPRFYDIECVSLLPPCKHPLLFSSSLYTPPRLSEPLPLKTDYPLFQTFLFQYPHNPEIGLGSSSQ